MQVQYNTECFCLIKGDEPLHLLECGHNIHYSCAIVMEKDHCPWCRSKMGLFTEIYLQLDDNIYFSRVIRTRYIGTIQPPVAIQPTGDASQLATGGQVDDTRASQSATGDNPVVYTGPITRSRNRIS
jgi:hypothetical protein